MGEQRGEREREFALALEGTGQPLKSSSNLEAFSEYHGYPFGISSQRQTTERRAANSLMGKHYGARHCEPLGSNRRPRQSKLFPRKRNRLFLLEDNGPRLYRVIRISVIHIYEDAIARGIKINGREGLIRAYTHTRCKVSRLS